jgi:alpha-aminoadipic semialdehyde synthase
MIKTIGIRREDKNEWERRVPLVSDDVAELREKYGTKTIIQPSKNRVFSDVEYLCAGAEVNEDLKAADAVFAMKEIPFICWRKDKCS